MNKRAYLFLWVAVSIVILIFTVIHPRLNNILLLLLCIIRCITLFFSKKEIERKGMLKKNLGFVIGLAILWYLGQYLNMFYPYHTTYEYRKDIANAKAGSTGEYYREFPDEIPEGAKDIEWICCPSFMQGSGYNILFFRANSSYIKELYEKYSDSTTEYTYSNYGWENKETGKAAVFPKIHDMTEEERVDVTVFVTYDNEDANHPHSSGLYINQAEGYACFFAQ